MNLKSQIFTGPNAVTMFVNDPANAVVTVVSITFDASSGVYVLFYTT